MVESVPLRGFAEFTEEPAVPQSQHSLEEPVKVTLAREFHRIGSKLKCVLVPRLHHEARAKELKDWDLWGPLLICLLLATLLSLTATLSGKKPDSASVFAIVFAVVWFGAAIISINAQLLGGNVSFFQSVCLLGYCVFPLTMSALVITVFGFVPGIAKLVTVLVGGVWSVVSSISFTTQLVPGNRKFLAEYPLVLFFFFLGWFILVVDT